MTKWKYMIQQFPTAGLEAEAIVERRQAEISLMGEYGWELVSTNVYANPVVGGDVVILFFKKPVADDIITTPKPGGRPGR